jgi:hypothetical protein
MYKLRGTVVIENPQSISAIAHNKKRERILFHTMASPPYVAYLAVHPFQGDSSAKHLSFPAGATVMAQPAFEKGGWIWGSVQGPGGVVVHGWSPVSYLSPPCSYLSPQFMVQHSPAPSLTAPAPQRVPFYTEQAGNPQRDQQDDDWGFDGPIMGGQASNTNSTSSQPQSSDAKRGALLSNVGSSFQKAGSSVTGVAAKTGSVVTGTAKKAGSSMNGAAKKTGRFFKSSIKETHYRLQDIGEQRSAKKQDETVQQEQQVVYQNSAASTKQLSASDQCMVDTGNGAAKGAVVGAAWGLVTGRGAVRGAAVGGTMGGAHGAVSKWKPFG